MAQPKTEWLWDVEMMRKVKISSIKEFVVMISRENKFRIVAKTSRDEFITIKEVDTKQEAQAYIDALSG